LIRKIETMMRIYVNIFFTKWFYRPECFKIQAKNLYSLLSFFCNSIKKSLFYR
jgi:hypothetical protein